MKKTILDYWLVLYSKKVVIGVIVLSALVTALVVSLVIPPVYEAKAVFFVPAKQDAVTFLSASGQSIAKGLLVPETKEEPHGPFIGILKSSAIAEAVQQEFPHKTVNQLMRRDMDFNLSEEFLLEVYARDGDPVKAAGIANAYVRHFNRLMEGYSENSKIFTARESLRKQIGKTEQDLRRARSGLERYQEKNKSASIEEETRQYVALKMSIKNKLDATTVALKENGIKINALKDQLAKEEILLSSEQVIVSSPLLESIQRQLTDIEVKMAGLRGEVTEAHPDFVALKNQSVQLKQGMEKEINRIVKSQIKAPNSFYENLRQQLVGLCVEKETLEVSMNASKALLKDIDEEMAGIPAIQAQTDNLEMNVERNKKNLDILKSNLEELMAQEGKEMQAGIIVDRADPPKKPAFPVLWLNLLLAGLAGFTAGVIYAFFINYIEETSEVRTLRIVKELLSEE